MNVADLGDALARVLPVLVFFVAITVVAANAVNNVPHTSRSSR